MLPNFCGSKALLITVISSQMGVVAITLMRSPFHPEPFTDFLYLTLFVQIVVLAWVGLVCSMMRSIQDEGWSVKRTYGTAYALAIMLGVLSGIASNLVSRYFPHLVMTQDYSEFSNIFRTTMMSGIIGFMVLRYLYLVYTLKQNVREGIEARALALQARIRPHFLFNTLNTIAELTRSNSEAAEMAVEDLARLYRMSMADVRRQTTLEEEIQTCKSYISIEKYRLGERLEVVWDIADDVEGSCSLPSLTLQPLVENAMYHGIEPRQDGGVVRIGGKRLGDGRIEISVINPLPTSERSNRHKGNNIALENIRQRFNLIFGKKAELVSMKIGSDYFAAIRFPYRT